MQIDIITQIGFLGIFVGTCLLFLLYVILKACTGGKMVRPERRGGTPKVDGVTSTHSAYGYDVSYAPGNGGSPAGPLPVGGKTERLPTRSFQDYTKPRRKSEED